MISSDESDGEAIVMKDLPWRSSRVTDFFKSLDEEAARHKSMQAKRQTKQRILGGSSIRSKPDKVPSWAVSHDE